MLLRPLALLERLQEIPGLKVSENVPLSKLTRFELGGPAAILADARSEEALVSAMEVIRESGQDWTLIGGGSNLVADDTGFSGVALRYTASAIEVTDSRVRVEAGARLQDLVNLTIERGWKGLETMTGIPGWVGGAIYGNAGAYGHSIDERVERVRFFNGSAMMEIDKPGCEFRYRESVFKSQKNWVITSAVLRLEPDDSETLRAGAGEILKIRNEKYPPSMRCAGSIFKNLILRELAPEVQALVPPHVIREGKVPSAYFLEQAGAKGMHKGGVRVAAYHANLIYNQGGGTSADVRHLIEELKARVERKFGLLLEEEVQYVGAGLKNHLP